MRDTVSDNKKEIGTSEYIDCYNTGFCDDGTVLIREDEFDYYRQFGGGIKTMNFVGIMYDTRKG